MPPRRRRPLTFRRMTPRQRETYGRALLAIHLARAESKSLTTAAREAGTRPKTVLRYARPALGKIKGRWAVKPEDRLPRPLQFYDERGEIVITVRTSHDASLIGEYHNAVRVRAETGDAGALRKFEGKAVQDVEGTRHPFITDSHTLNRFARAGVLSGFEEIYSLSS